MSAEYLNERFAFPGFVKDRIGQWVTWAHSGPSVVPRNWMLEVDRHEPRLDPDPLIGDAVEKIYRRWHAHNASQARVIVAMCFGARKGLIKSMARDPYLVRVVEVVVDDAAPVMARWHPPLVRPDTTGLSIRVEKKKLDFRRRDADDLLRVFAREVGDINISKAMADAAAKINRPAPMATIEEYRKPLPRPKVNSPEWVAQHFARGAK